MQSIIRTGVAAGLLGLCALSGAQTTQDLLNDAQTTGDVLVNGMGYAAQRYSPLTQINKTNVKRLVPVWNTSLASNTGEQAQPVIHDGVMYVTTFNATFAIDALSGRVLWRSALDLDPGLARVICCGQVNRGAALYEGKVFRGTPDAFMQALDAKTGKELWRTKLLDWEDGYSITGSPIVANGVLITGMAGGEYGVRGFIAGFDPATGKELWRHHTVPGENEPGSDSWPSNDMAKRGGGTTWGPGSYDPKLDLVYWGTGNAGPWDSRGRKGDNKNTASVIAVRPKTGELVWAFQFTPNDAFDFDSISQMVLADIKVNGQTRPVLMHADKNGFMYVLDRSNGKYIAGNKFVKVTWADGLDPNGRPILSAATKRFMENNDKIETWPSNSGGVNWHPMAYSPRTGLLYANTLEFGMEIVGKGPVEYKSRGQLYMGVSIKKLYPEDGNRGYLKAIDPLTGNIKWQVPAQIPHWAGTLVTASDIVFTGDMLGAFKAFDANTGKVLWSFQTGSGIVSQPITWEHKGRQYVTVLSGIGGVYAQNSGDERLRNVPTGGSAWTFALFDNK
ncbi:alcohol dehydrogenase (cytochrome c) [Noviherbaspirillum humi]|uniref:Alcohol dehydrogenase (Cytochrome c) n=1 Tax=Noviherbaspirillum humi TaxID=1688639 RepID=A0A239I411_9BURK|nr:PQQ-dependent dehydrogenase, methanol/ethanol family [Noviherbaspirillum humi]SNS88102.1 alcohol dehydrogenase (cytochrome c) [Noviherbaspirillum humi]